MSKVEIKTRLDTSRSPYPTLFEGQEAIRPYGREGLGLRLDQVEDVCGTKRVKSHLVAWYSGQRVKYLVKDSYSLIPVEIFVRYGGVNYCSVREWYSWLNWVPAFSVDVTIEGQTYTFSDPNDAARQMSTLGLQGHLSDPIQFGIDLERTWSKRESD